jgi:hypothetical protein
MNFIKRISDILDNKYVFRSVILVAFMTGFILTALYGCATAPVVEAPKSPEIKPVPVQQGKCELIEETLVLQNQVVKLPAIGRMPLESHLVAKEDKRTSWPKNQTEGISKHLEMSCALLKAKVPAADCNKAYQNPYAKLWTPSEGGHIGQGSGAIPSLEQEMWSGNLYWTAKNKPKVGVNDKFLVCANAKCVVITMGFETGPGDKALLGGLQPESMYVLGADNRTPITLGRLKDQSLPLGPRTCK